MEAKTETPHLLVRSATASAAPQKSAKTSMPSSAITVLSTSKQTAYKGVFGEREANKTGVGGGAGER